MTNSAGPFDGSKPTVEDLLTEIRDALTPKKLPYESVSMAAPPTDGLAAWEQQLLDEDVIKDVLSRHRSALVDGPDGLHDLCVAREVCRSRLDQLDDQIAEIKDTVRVIDARLGATP